MNPQIVTLVRDIVTRQCVRFDRCSRGIMSMDAAEIYIAIVPVDQMVCIGALKACTETITVARIVIWLDYKLSVVPKPYEVCV